MTFDYPKIQSAVNFPYRKCVAFVKYDGTNIGVEWTPELGFHQFRLRKRPFDLSDSVFGPVIPLFHEKYSEKVDKVLRERFKVDRIIVFGEFFGPSTFAGNHLKLPVGEKRDMVIFDVWQENYGFLGPEEFVQLFGHLDIAKIIYSGVFSGKLTDDIRQGKYKAKGVVEGAIIKGGKGGSDVGMCKVKTTEYMDRLKQVFGTNWQNYWE